MWLYNYTIFLAERFSTLMSQHIGVLQATVRCFITNLFLKMQSRLKITTKLKSFSFTSVLSNFLSVINKVGVIADIGKIVNMSLVEWQVENSTLKCIMMEKMMNVTLVYIFAPWYKILLRNFAKFILCISSLPSHAHDLILGSYYFFHWLLKWIFHQLFILKNFKHFSIEKLEA